MTAPDQPRKPSWFKVWFSLALFLAVLVLYQLSVGPVVWLMQHEKLPESVLPCVQIAYAPIGLTASNCKWYGNLLDRYLLLWGVEH